MVQSLGLLVSHQLAPFEPESGAYSGQTNHSHSHSHKTEV
jgi:urease accessory protein UreE